MDSYLVSASTSDITALSVRHVSYAKTRVDEKFISKTMLSRDVKYMK